MTIPRQISEFLEAHHVPYRHGTHEPVYTAREMAHVLHISGDLLAKAVMVMTDGGMVMAVLPSTHRVDLDRLRGLLGADAIRLATEEEFARKFPGCERGAMPPFGELYGLEVWFDATLKGHPTIVFNAGTHTDTLQMRYGDLERLVHPHIGSFAELHH